MNLSSPPPPKTFSIVEHPQHGRCVLKGFWSEWEWALGVAITSIVNGGSRQVAPRFLALINLGLEPSKHPDLLEAAGFPRDVAVLNGGADFCGVIQHCGGSLQEGLRRAKEAGDKAEALRLLLSLTTTIGTFHGAGLIADDTHVSQFIVNDSGEVIRIDVEGGRPIDGPAMRLATPEHWAVLQRRPGRLTQLGFEVGRWNEWQFIRSLIVPAMPGGPQAIKDSALMLEGRYQDASGLSLPTPQRY